MYYKGNAVLQKY